MNCSYNIGKKMEKIKEDKREVEGGQQKLADKLTKLHNEKAEKDHVLKQEAV